MTAFPVLTLTHHYRLIGHFKGAATGTWRSEFAIKQTSGVPAPTDAIVVAAKDYWIANLRHDCTLDSLELRAATWGDQPFSTQGAIWRSPVEVLGDKITVYGAEAANAVGIEVCAYVKYFTSGPKPGKQFLRQLLDTGDIAAVPGDPWVFLPSGGHVTPALFRGNSINNGLATGWFGTADPGLRIIHFSLKAYNADHSNLPFSTTIDDFALERPMVNKATRKNPK